MAELFGFSFKKNQEKSRAPSPIQPSSDDGRLRVILQEVTMVSILT